jgi:hypothetical protein
MHSLLTLDSLAGPEENQDFYHAGNALGWLHRGNKQAAINHLLSGRLYLAKSGWLLLSVPNALIRGVYDAMSAPGAELPAAGLMNVPNVPADLLNAHISVMTAEEVKKVGADNINERGHMFGYSLGSMTEITPKNVDGISKIWAIQVSSPALSSLRKSYGLSPLINNDHAFHITVAVRRKKVLQNNDVSKFDGAQGRGELKAASADTVTYDCNCAGACMCPETCTCKQHGRCGGAHKAASATVPQPRVRVVLPYEGKYLLEKLTNPKWPENLGKRRFIGGGIDGNETPEQAAAREMFEELGVKIKPTAFRPLGPDNREGQSHVQYLELPQHTLKPGVFNATIGSDAQITLEHGMPEGPDYYGPDIKTLLAPALKKTATSSRSGTKVSRAGQKDLLQGGKADNIPEREFSSRSLAEGASHEHEHTDNNQVAKEIAKDHLSEDPHYYEKVKSIEKAAGKPRIIDELLLAKRHSDNKRYGHKTQILRKLMEQSPQDWMIDDSAPQFPGITHTPTKFQFHTDRTAIPKGVKAASVYGTAAQNVLFNPRNPLAYDHTKPVFENIQKQLAEIKSRGDFMMRAQRNNQTYRATIDPNYRHQLALQAFHGTMPQPALSDQMIETYGDGMLGAMAHAGRR